MAVAAFDLIPEPRREAAAEALSAAGVGQVEGVRPIVGGASGALICRVDAGGRRWLLRLDVIGGIANLPRAYGCMRAAADAGVAPALRYADPDRGVTVMDFVESRPIDAFPGGPVALIAALAGLIARVHAIAPPFPSALADYPFMVEHLMGRLRGSDLFRPGLLEPHAEGLARIRAAYRFEGPGVSCHNDPNRMNVLWDGERLWLVDWELAFRNDPLVDVGILAENFAPTAEGSQALLAAWHGREPDGALRARFALARQLSRGFYAGVLLSGFARSPPPEPDDLSALSVAEFTQALAEGRLKVGSPEVLYALGKMQLASFLAGMSSSEVMAALAIGATD